MSKVPSDNYSKCKVSSFEVMEVLPRKSGWCSILSDDGNEWHYKMRGIDDHPKPFAMIKVFWNSQENGGKMRKVIRKWGVEKEDLASDETGQTEIEEAKGE